MSQSVKGKWSKIYFGGVFLYFFIIRFLVIPSGDDFFWAGAQGDYLLRHAFYGPQAIYGGSSNGRYIGNFLEIVTMHHLLLAMLMYGIFWSLLIWCLWSLTGKTRFSLVLSSLFVFTFQVGYLSTVLSWNAGFINYVPPIALILLYLVWVQRDWNNKLNYNKWFLIVAAGLISLVGGLFVEHLTLYQIFIGLIVMTFGKFVLNKKIKLFELSYLSGAVVAAGIMFTHRAYYEHSTYRNTNLDIHALANNFLDVTHFWSNTLNLIVNIVICLTVIMLSSKLIQNNWRKIFTQMFAGFFIIYFLIINLWLRGKVYNQYFIYRQLADAPITRLDGMMTIVFWLFLIYATLTFFNIKGNYLVYFSLMTYFALTAPFLLIVAPINPREFFTAYVFLYLMALFFVGKVLILYKFEPNRYFRLIITLLLIFCTVNIGVKMTMNYQANQNRINDEQFLAGKTGLKTHVPFRKYVLSNDALLQQSGLYWQGYLNKTWLERI